MIGVREPGVRYTGPSETETKLIDEVEASIELIRTLRQVELFAEVDFTEALSSPPDRELVAHPQQARCQAAEQVAALAVFPLVFTRLELQQGLRFSVSGHASEIFELRYCTVSLSGPLALLISPWTLSGLLDDWTIDDRRYVLDARRRFFEKNVERLQRLALRPGAAEPARGDRSRER